MHKNSKIAWIIQKIHKELSHVHKNDKTPDLMQNTSDPKYQFIYLSEIIIWNKIMDDLTYI